MQLTVYKHEGNYNKKSCYVHARAAWLGDGHLLITTQLLDVSGCDDFSGLEVLHTFDGGETITVPKRDSAFGLKDFSAEVEYVECDATPMYLPRANKVFIIGHYAFYEKETHKLSQGHINPGYYAIYDKDNACFMSSHSFVIDAEETYIHRAPGCSQYIELPSGEILIPFTLRPKDGVAVVCVYHFSFDGERLIETGKSNILSYPVARGACEPSLAYHNGRYYLTVRNDEIGLFSTSEDGYHFSELSPWHYDDGALLENYNTQQHFLTLGNEIYLVYTRRGANNDHVFRHRAPLFIAKIDTDSVCLVRESEQVAVPERGARLGNFGVTNVSENLAYITVTEWMQPRGCEAYGSDNALFIVKVEKQYAYQA